MAKSRFIRVNQRNRTPLALELPRSVTLNAVMPITPFHFGPGAALHAGAPRYVSFMAFCAANVLMDVEPLYYMLTRQYPLHRFFHTYIGATIVAMATVAFFAVGRRVARNLEFPYPAAIGLGAIAGSYSHVLLDSVMHRDIRPFAPFSDANPLLGLVSVPALHWFCLICGLVGVAILVSRPGPGSWR